MLCCAYFCTYFCWFLLLAALVVPIVYCQLSTCPSPECLISVWAVCMGPGDKARTSVVCTVFSCTVHTLYSVQWPPWHYPDMVSVGDEPPCRHLLVCVAICNLVMHNLLNSVGWRRSLLCSWKDTAQTGHIVGGENSPIRSVPINFVRDSGHSYFRYIVRM